MIMYRDKRGTQISKERWEELIRNESYSIIARQKIKEYLITACWVGVHSTLENKPRIFLLNIKSNNNEDKDYWFSTEDAMMKKYEKVLLEHIEHD